MTNRDGDIVQHYGYTAYGDERYKNNTAAFDVTNRYTGQQIDEETGLYFYQSRYYDAQLGRFTQADTIVPSAETSQALNRYAYVANNPLKFTDPSGHGWFSKLWKSIKPYIGTIITAALMVMTGGAYAAVCGLIGGAIGGAINGGTWKSVFIGAAIGYAAGAIASGMGFDAPDVFAEGFKWTTETIMQGLVAGAVTGAVSGAISSAVYGGKVLKNMVEGAKSGAIGTAVGMAAQKVCNALKPWIHGIKMNIELFLNMEIFPDMRIPSGQIVSSDKGFGVGLLEKTAEGIEKLENSGLGWFLNSMNDGFCAWIDGVIPFGDPLEKTYEGVDGTGVSRATGHVSRDAILAAATPNLAEFVEHPWLYEIGQKTLPVLPKGWELLSAAEKGRIIVNDVGWIRAIVPTLKAEPYVNTVGTGLTPLGNLVGISALEANDIYQDEVINYWSDKLNW